ncbi:hypothetical protein PENTCL1PPCAC_27629, partial [Pristionchus entomophagus]
RNTVIGHRSLLEGATCSCECFDIKDPEGLERIIRATIHEFEAVENHPGCEMKEKEMRIRELREANNQSVPISIYRQCSVCLSSHSHERAVLVPCAHIMCMECVNQLKVLKSLNKTG